MLNLINNNEMNSSSIKVMILITQLGYGGAQKLVFDFVRTFSGKEFSIKIGMWGGRKDTYKDFQDLGVEVIDFGGKSKFDLIAFWRLFQYLKYNNIDILHTHLPYSHIVGRLAARLAGVTRIISTLQNVYQSQHTVSRLVDRWTVGFSDIVTAVSQGVEESYFKSSEVFTTEALYQGKTHFTIYNGVDICKVDQALNNTNKEKKLASLNLSSDNLNIVCAARLHPNKGHTYLLNAIAKLAHQFPKIHFLFLGDGPLETTLKNQAQQLIIDNYITFLGYRKDVYEIFKAVDVFILPSINEGLPISVVEAMAASLPVIATKIPGVQEVVEDNMTGWLVPPADANALAQTIEKLLMFPEKLDEFAKNGRIRAEERFSIHSITLQYKAVYTFLINN